MGTGFYIYTADPNNPPCGFTLAWTGTDPDQFNQQLDNFQQNGPAPWDWGSYETPGPVPIIKQLGPNVQAIWIRRFDWSGPWFNAWTGPSYPQYLQVRAALEAQGYIIQTQCYPANQPPPPPPPPPPQPCPPGSHWDPNLEQCVPDNVPPPPPPPSDDTTDDEIVVLLEFVIGLLQKLNPSPGGSNDACCKAVTLAITSIATQLVTLTHTIQQLGGTSPTVNIDLTAVVQAIDRVNATLIADQSCCKAIDADLQAIARAIAERPTEAADPNVKRIADTLNGFPPDEPGADAKIDALIDLGVRKYGLPADFAQIVKS